MRGTARGAIITGITTAGPEGAASCALSEPDAADDLDRGGRVLDAARPDLEAAVAPALCADLRAIHPDFRAALRDHCAGCRGAGGPCAVRELRAQAGAAMATEPLEPTH